MKNRYNKTLISKYFWTALSILSTASVFFSSNQSWLIFFFLLTGVILIFQKKLYWSHEIKLVLIFLAIITLLQTIAFLFFSFWTTAGTFIRFILPWFFLLLIGKDYLKYFVKVMYIFTLINFLFFIPSLLVPGFFNFLSKLPQLLGMGNIGEGTTTILYTVETSIRNGIRQNSGPFFEPGQYASYLTMALVFNLFRYKKLFIKENILFFVALVFTQSTAGYLFLFMIIGFYLLMGKSNRIFGIGAFIVVLYLGYNFYERTDFLGAKITKQYNNMLVQNRNNSYGNGSDRTTTTANDFIASLKSPLIGLGRNDKTRYGDEVVILTKFIKSNTTFDIAASFGYPFFLLYFFLIFSTFKKMTYYYGISKKYAWFLTVLIAIMYIPQTLYLHNSFLILLYLGSVYKTMPYDHYSHHHTYIQ